MPDPYSPLLLVAIVLVGVAAAARMAALFGWRPPPRLVNFSSLAALDIAVLALLLHLALGHRPGTPEGLGPIDFLFAHPAPLIVVAVALVVRKLGWPA